MPGSSMSPSYSSLLLFLFIVLFFYYMSLSLRTEWRLRSRLSMGYIQILCSLSFYFSSSVSPVSSDCVAFTSLSLPTVWRLRSSPFSLLLALSPPDAISDALAAALQIRSKLSPTECIRLDCSFSFAFCLSLFRLNCGFVALPTELRLRSRLSPSECIRLHAPSHLISVYLSTLSSAWSFSSWCIVGFASNGIAAT
jgi:hypothetical protein